MSNSLKSLYSYLLEKGWYPVGCGIHDIDNKKGFVVASVKKMTTVSWSTDRDIFLRQNLHFAQSEGSKYMVGVFGIEGGVIVNYKEAIEYFSKILQAKS